jgi:hypothetical protein
MPLSSVSLSLTQVLMVWLYEGCESSKRSAIRHHDKSNVETLV